MNNLLKCGAVSLCTLVMAASLTACGGGGSSSSSPTTVPNSDTVFYAHNVIFRNSTTFATGYNGFGQLGTGSLANRTTFGATKGERGFSGVATGGDHSVAFFNNSTVRSWGDNRVGQLGINSIVHSDIPKKVVMNDDLQLSNVVQVAAGSKHSLALRSDGTVWAWGLNFYGQLGVPKTGFTDKDFKQYAVPVTVAGDPLKKFVAIAANGFNSLALDSSGRVYAWGLNGSGQLGVDPAIVGDRAVPTPVAFPGDNVVVVAIVAGGASFYAIDTDGKLWAWGNNFNGQLCIGSTDDTSMPTLVDKLPPGVKVAQVAAGIQHVLIRLEDASVWSCGYNIYGQLGNNDKLKKDSSVPVQVLSADGITAFKDAIDIRAFGSSSMVKTAAEGWFAWGDNTFGQLGSGGKETHLLPADVGEF